MQSTEYIQTFDAWARRLRVMGWDDEEIVGEAAQRAASDLRIRDGRGEVQGDETTKAASDSVPVHGAWDTWSLDGALRALTHRRCEHGKLRGAEPCAAECADCNGRCDAHSRGGRCFGDCAADESTYQDCRCQRFRGRGGS